MRAQAHRAFSGPAIDGRITAQMANTAAIFPALERRAWRLENPPAHDTRIKFMRG
jgi:hypothetical protein